MGEKHKVYPRHELGTDPLHPMPDEEWEDGAPLSDTEVEKIRNNSSYSETDKAAPDNNLFFEKRNNPLSSKGD